MTVLEDMPDNHVLMLLVEHQWGDEILTLDQVVSY